MIKIVPFGTRMVLMIDNIPIYVISNMELAQELKR